MCCENISSAFAFPIFLTTALACNSASCDSGQKTRLSSSLGRTARYGAHLESVSRVSDMRRAVRAYAILSIMVIRVERQVDIPAREASQR